MKKYLAVFHAVILSLLICSQAFGASMYWKSLAADCPVTTNNADKCMVIDDDSETVYTHTSGAWVAIANASYVKMEDYLPAGYVTNGSVDYSTQIQAALDTGNYVLVPQGIFAFATGLTMNTSHAGIIGYGRNSILKHTGTGIALSLASSANTEVVDLNNFQLLGTSSATGGLKIGTASLYVAFLNADRLTVRGFTKTNAWGVSLNSIQEGVFHNCRIEYNYDNFYRPNEGYLTSTTISGRAGHTGNSTRNGFYSIGSVGDLVIGDTLFEACGSSAIKIAGSDVEVTIDGAYFEANGTVDPTAAEIDIAGTSTIYTKARLALVNNYFHLTNGPTLKLDYVISPIISNNKGLIESLDNTLLTNSYLHFYNNRIDSAADPQTIFPGLTNGVITAEEYESTTGKRAEYGDKYIYGRHIFMSSTSSPTCSVGPAAGEGAECYIITGSTDSAGEVRIDSTGVNAVTGILVTVTYGTPYTNKPFVIYSKGDNYLGADMNSHVETTLSSYVTSDTDKFTITRITADNTGLAYRFSYRVN